MPVMKLQGFPIILWPPGIFWPSKVIHLYRHATPLGSDTYGGQPVQTVHTTTCVARSQEPTVPVPVRSLATMLHPPHTTPQPKNSPWQPTAPIAAAHWVPLTSVFSHCQKGRSASTSALVRNWPALCAKNVRCRRLGRTETCAHHSALLSLHSL